MSFLISPLSAWPSRYECGVFHSWRQDLFPLYRTRQPVPPPPLPLPEPVPLPTTGRGRQHAYALTRSLHRHALPGRSPSTNAASSPPPFIRSGRASQYRSTRGASTPLSLERGVEAGIDSRTTGWITSNMRCRETGSKGSAASLCLSRVHARACLNLAAGAAR
jgi:hypothetical protein